MVETRVGDPPPEARPVTGGRCPERDRPHPRERHAAEDRVWLASCASALAAIGLRILFRLRWLRRRRGDLLV